MADERQVVDDAKTADSGIHRLDLEGLLARAERSIATLELYRDQSRQLRPFQFADFRAPLPDSGHFGIETAVEAKCDVTIQLGRARIPSDRIADLRTGSILCLDKRHSDPLEIVADGRLVGKGELMVRGDRICVRVTELIAREANSSVVAEMLV
jgi:flagellar motor switch protein FliN/FliY